MTSKLRETIRIGGTVKADPKRCFPAAKIDFTFSLEKVKGKVVAKVIAGYLKLTSRKGGVAKIVPFDDGRAVLDFNAHGEAIGIELLAGNAPYMLTEFARHLDGSKDSYLICAANTITSGWSKVEILANAAMDGVRELREARGLPPAETLDLDDDMAEDFKKKLESKFELALVPAA